MVRNLNSVQKLGFVIFIGLNLLIILDLSHKFIFLIKFDSFQSENFIEKGSYS